MSSARTELLARRAEERRALGRMPSLLPHLDLVIGGSLLVPLAVVLGVYSIGTLSGGAHRDPRIWLGWLIVGAGIGLLAANRRGRARRQRALSDGLDRLSLTLSGRRLGGFDETVDWMNRFWAGPVVVADLFRGAVRGSLAGTMRAYPVLVDVEPDGYAIDESRADPRVLVYVAALAPAVPPSVAAPGAVDEAATALRRAGFEPAIVADAGLLARATRPTVAVLRRDLGRAADLAPVVRDLVRMAAACGADPPRAPAIGP